MADKANLAEPRSRPARRAFEFASEPPTPGATTPAAEASSPSLLTLAQPDDGEPPARSRSIMNLTSSTLSGIYQTSGYASDRDDTNTNAQWATYGAETPIGESRHGSFDLSKMNLPDTVLLNGPNGKVRRRRSTMNVEKRRIRPSPKERVFLVMRRLIALFGVGVLYGAIVIDLHDRREVAPVPVKGVPRSSWRYPIFWGVIAIMIGEAQPWFDKMWTGNTGKEDEAVDDAQHHDQGNDSRGMGVMSDVLRSIGTFAGLALAIRKIPWQSTLQMSLTLALVNPAIWYMIDRSSAGFVLSTLVALSSTALLLVTNPQLIPTPSTGTQPATALLRAFKPNVTATPLATDELVLGLVTQESIGVATWIASVFFISAVCFGNIGRRLASS